MSMEKIVNWRLAISARTASLVCALAFVGCGDPRSGDASHAEIARLTARVRQLEKTLAKQQAHLAGLEEAYADLARKPAPAPTRKVALQPRPAPKPGRTGDPLAVALLALAQEQEQAVAAMVAQWEEICTALAASAGDDAPEEVQALLTRLNANTAQRVQDLARQQRAVTDALRKLVRPE